MRFGRLASSAVAGVSRTSVEQPIRAEQQLAARRRTAERAKQNGVSNKAPGWRARTATVRAAEAVVALLAVAADHGLSRVIADTTLDNVASQRTLIRAGFRLVGTDGELHHYEALTAQLSGRSASRHS